MNIEELRAAYRQQGFCLVRNFFSAETIDRTRNEAKEIFSVQIKANGIHDGAYAGDEDFEKSLYTLFTKNYAAFIGAAKLAQHAISLHKLAVDETILRMLHDLGIGRPSICVKPIIYFNSRHLAKIEGHYKTPAHQDWRSMQGSLNAMVVWIPLVDIDISLGAIEMVPGSHRHGLLDSEKDEWFRHVEGLEDKDFVPVEVKKGDVVFFSAFTAHRSGNNVTEKIRWSMHFRYNDMLEPTWIERNYPHPYVVYRPEQEIISPGFPSKEQIDRVFG